MGKKLAKAKEDIERMKEYSIEEAITFIKQKKYAKFDETVDLAVNLGVDPRKSDQMVCCCPMGPARR
jgi:large subunit ribosomal protein L1